MFDYTVDLVVEVVEGTPQWWRGRPGTDEVGDAGIEHAVVQPGEEDRRGEAEVGDVVAQCVRDALDEPVEAEPAQVVGHAALGHGTRGEPEQRGEEFSQVAVGEPIG